MSTLRLERKGNTLCAYLSCEIDHHTAKEIRRTVDCKVKESVPDELILDFSGVAFMDSSGIGLILGRLELCREVGIPLRVRGHTGLVGRLITMSGVGRLRNITLE